MVNDGLWYTEGDRFATAVARARERAKELVATWRWAKEAAASHPLRGRTKCMLWRETSPQHFATKTGTFRTQRTQKTLGWVHQLGCRPHEAHRVASPWEAVHKVLEADGIPVVRIWNSSREHWDLHISNRTRHMLYRHRHENDTSKWSTIDANFDCSHWCTPGVVDTWVTLLMQSVDHHCALETDHVQ